MGMLTAWSILNKVASRGDKRFSDVVVAVCSNVTIRDRLTELQPERGDASIYRTRDLVPERMMPQLTQGRVRLKVQPGTHLLMQQEYRKILKEVFDENARAAPRPMAA